jgi:GDP-L-fucose synthase
MLREDPALLVNVGYGSDVTIRGLAETICRVLDFDGDLVFDLSKPDGTPRKLLDSSRLRALGWQARIDLETGIRMAFEAAKSHLDQMADCQTERGQDSGRAVEGGNPRACCDDL